MMNDNDNRNPIADAMREAADRREAARKEMAANRWMPAKVNRPAPRSRRTSVRHRAIR